MCFEYQGIIFKGKKVIKFSQMLTVRPEGVAPSPLYGQPDPKISVVFFEDFLREVVKKRISYVGLFLHFLDFSWG